jgi:hypothetical protein
MEGSVPERRTLPPVGDVDVDNTKVRATLRDVREAVFSALTEALMVSPGSTVLSLGFTFVTWGYGAPVVATAGVAESPTSPNASANAHINRRPT